MQWNGIMELNHGVESWNGIMQWNHAMESWSGIMEWNHVKWVFYMRKSNIRTSGIEPESRPWKGGVLPLYYVRVVSFFYFVLCMCRAC